MSEPQLVRIKPANDDWPNHFKMGRQAISTAPFGRDLQLAMIDANGIHALVFRCRRVLYGWVNAENVSVLSAQRIGANGATGFD